MKKTVVLLGVMLVLVLAVSPVSAMVGGELDTEHANVGAIMMVWPQFGNIVGRLCTATLIHPQALVTAAHCYPYFEEQGIGYDEIWITFDQDPFADDAIYLNVENFIPHEDFNFYFSADTHDIALVILTEPVEGISYEELPELGYMDEVVNRKKGQKEMEMNVVGYGTSEYIYPPDTQLDAIRRNGTVLFSHLLPYEIKSEPNNAILCLGDSGGPLFHVDNKSEIMVGVLSRGGDKCASEKFHGFHYRLDTASALEFIADNLPAE